MNRLKDRLMTFYLFIYLNTNPKIERKLLNAKKKINNSNQCESICINNMFLVQSNHLDSFLK